MSENFLTKQNYRKKVISPKSADFAALMQSADAFICAAGFERRGQRSPLAVKEVRNPIIIAFRNGPPQNDKTLNLFASKFSGMPGFDVCELDLARPEAFEASFEVALRKIQHLQTGRMVLDISALTNFAICIAVVKVRQIFPTANLILLYTEAEEYFPTKKDFNRIKHLIIKQKTDLFPEFLSGRASNMFIPSMFSGVALGHNDTCLVIFAGYEPHRTNCAIEAINPSKLVMVYGEPERKDLKWRLELSQMMHNRIDTQIMKTEEVSSASDVIDNLKLLMKYYEYLYDDHVISVCPLNSKMQAVASALAWETYPDIQLSFPVPAEYLPKRFSVEWRDTFVIDLGVSPLAQRFL